MKKMLKKLLMSNQQSKEFSLNNIVKIILSVAKQYNLEEVNVPLWNKEFPMVPSLYCSDLSDYEEQLKCLKQHIDIELIEGYIYLNEDIKGIPEFDECRYVRVYILSIKNISNVKYFGVDRHITYALESMFERYAISMERLILKNNTFTGIVNFKSTHAIRNSYIIFLIAVNSLKKYRIELETNTYEQPIKNSSLFFKKNKVVTVFNISYNLKKKFTVIK